MNINPELYDQTNRLQERDGLSLIRMIQQDQEKGIIPTRPHLVVDVGCGTGNITDHFDDWLSCDKIIGLDVSKEMIDYAQLHHASDQGVITYRTGDIASSEGDHLRNNILGMNGDLSDLVISIHCLHWIPEENQNLAMSNIRSLLKPGGRCYLWIFSWSDMLPLQEQMVYHPKWRKYFKSVIDAEEDAGGERKKSPGSSLVPEKKKRRKSSAPFPTFDPPPAQERIQVWRQRCQHLRFHDYDVQLKRVDYNFENWASFKEILKSICHFLPYIPGEEQASFLDDYYEHVHNTYVARKAAMGGTRLYVLDYECLVVTATKPLQELEAGDKNGVEVDSFNI